MNVFILQEQTPSKEEYIKVQTVLRQRFVAKMHVKPFFINSWIDPEKIPTNDEGFLANPNVWITSRVMDKIARADLFVYDGGREDDIQNYYLRKIAEDGGIATAEMHDIFQGAYPEMVATADPVLDSNTVAE